MWWSILVISRKPWLFRHAVNTHERGRAASDWHSDRGSAAHDQLHGLQQLGNRWHHSGSPVKEAAMLCEDLPQSNSHLKPRLVQLFLVKWIERLSLCRFHSLSLRMLIVWTPNTARMNLKLCQPSQEHQKLNFYTPTVWKYFLTVLCFVNLVQASIPHKAHIFKVLSTDQPGEIQFFKQWIC